VKGTATATDKWREKILAEALAHVAFDGWHDKTLKAAADKVGASDAELKAAFPRGVADALLFFSSEADRQAVEAIESADLKPMRVRERVTFAVRQRVEAVMKHKEAARRGAAVFALPQHALDGTTAVYRTVDALWRAIGDTSADFNFYTKRLLLSGVYTTTMLYWFADNSEDAEDTWKFLGHRIENVMQIEKLRAQVGKMTEGLPNPLSILGALRYPKR
jgi:ubiquinone biosynthesis protein COQ9